MRTQGSRSPQTKLPKFHVEGCRMDSKRSLQCLQAAQLLAFPAHQALRSGLSTETNLYLIQFLLTEGLACASGSLLYTHIRFHIHFHNLAVQISLSFCLMAAVLLAVSVPQRRGLGVLFLGRAGLPCSQQSRAPQPRGHVLSVDCPSVPVTLALPPALEH